MKLLEASFITSATTSTMAEGRLLYSIDFSDVKASDAGAWIKQRGFTKIESAAKDPDKLGLYSQTDSLQELPEHTYTIYRQKSSVQPSVARRRGKPRASQP